jgi:hypothetical protein
LKFVAAIICRYAARGIRDVLRSPDGASIVSSEMFRRSLSRIDGSVILQR